MTFLGFWGAFMIGGCSLLGLDDAPEKKDENVEMRGAKQVKKGDGSQSPLDAAIAAQDGYVYNPIGKRDPFRSFLASGGRIQDETPRTPLQKYELDKYLLVGIIWGVERPRALVEDPDSVGHVMEIGTYIGKNWGKVTAITSGEVVVTEEYQTIDGELVVHPISMTLPVNDDESF